MAKTLWQMMTDKVKGAPPVESVIDNPLGVRLGGVVTLNALDYRDNNFVVQQINNCARRVGREEYNYVEYVLSSRPISGPPKDVKLRLVPADHPDKAAGVTHTPVVLSMYDQMAYSDEFYKVVTDTTKLFEVYGAGGEVAEQFWRINDVQDSYKVTVTEATDPKATAASCPQRKLEYWDYWRQVPDEAGQPEIQFLFVEMDSESGWFQLWRGVQLDPQQVSVL